MARNVFDQFDTPSPQQATPAKNVFDQFDAPQDGLPPALFYGLQNQPKEPELVRRGAILPMSTYRNEDGTEFSKFDPHAGIAAPFTAVNEYLERGARPDDPVGDLERLGPAIVASLPPLGRVGGMGAPKAVSQVSDDVLRSRNMAQDMRDLKIEPFAPVVAMARRDGNSPGALTQTLMDKPFVGAPIQRGARQFMDESADALENIRSGYGQSRTLEGGGDNVRAAIDTVKNERVADVATMAPDKLVELSRSPPRLSTYKDVQAAKYKIAEDFLPPEKAKAQPVAEGEERIIGGMPNTTAILREIKRQYGLTINKAEAARAAKRGKGDGQPLSLESAPDFRNPRWTGSQNIDASLDALVSAGGNWRTGLEGMRLVRSNIRRLLSSKADTEVNALSRGHLKQLYQAVSADMDRLLLLKEQQATKAGDAGLAAGYRNARTAYKDADTFTAQYSERFEQLNDLFGVKSGEALAGKVMTAMQNGTRGDLQKLVTLRRVAPAESMDELASALLVELGRPTGRASSGAQEAGVSLSRWASRWNEMTPRSKHVVFGSKPELYQSLNKLARVLNASKDFEALANNSRTGVSNWVWGGVAAGGASAAALSPQAILTVIGTAMAGYGASKFLTSPTYVNWLTKSVQLQRSGHPIVVAKHLRSLKGMIEKDRSIPPPVAANILQAIAANDNAALRNAASSDERENYPRHSGDRPQPKQY